MNHSDELLDIAEAMSKLKKSFFNSSEGLVLPSEEQSRFEGLVVEARAIINTALGPANDFTLGIINAVTTGSGGFFGGPSHQCLGTVEELVRGAVRQINRKVVAQVSPLRAPSTPPYVDHSRIASIQALRSNKWDFAKLSQLCKELNHVHDKGGSYSVAMLVRAITDHIPPVFGMTTFAQVASNYAGSQSFKKSMQHLQGSLRNIADGLLHEQIRSRESLPSPQQVDFRQDLDRLLGEIVRIANENHRQSH